MQATSARRTRFERESARMLRIDMDGSVWLKPGAAIAYRGEIAFGRRPTLQARSPADAAMRELSPLVRAVGTGRLYCGHHGAHVELLNLENDTLYVVWQELLAFEETLQFEATIVAHGLGVAAGGLIAVRLSGYGSVAILAHGEPLALTVSPDNPLSTDPHATVAWSGGLTPAMKTDLSWRSVLCHGGHEPVQMFFEGTGRVLVQPYEDPRRVSFSIKPLEELKTLLLG